MALVGYLKGAIAVGKYWVACREDRFPNGRKGKYVLSSKTFETLKEAVAYKASISISREPMVMVALTVANEKAGIS